MKRSNAMVWGLVLLVAGAGAAWATDYTWTYAGTGNWSNAPQRWTPNNTNFPGQAAGDKAIFSDAVGRTVTLNVNPPNAVDAFNVTNGGAWTLAGNTFTLGLGAGNLNYDGANTLATFSSFEAMLSGSGGVRMNSGALRLGSRNVPGGTTTHSNQFAGGVEVNGGVLLSGHSSWEVSSGKELGTGGFIIGSASSGSNDATLLLHYGGNYTNSLTIRAGNSGVARLGRSGQGQNSIRASYLSGPVTLEKDLAIVSDEAQISTIWGRDIFYSLNLSGPMTGSGNVLNQGLGMVYFEGVNSYTGRTTIRGGTTYLRATNNSNTGDFTVEYGALIAQTNESLGNAANTVTLGTNGTFGEFGCYQADGGSRVVRFFRSITLAGNGGVLSARGYYPSWKMDGVISGSGRLILAPGGTGYIQGNNNYTGGTIANNGTVDILDGVAANNTVYGSGDIWILRNGYLKIRGVNNIGAGAKVKVDSPATIGVPIEYVPNLTTNSDGVMAFGLTSGTTIHNRLGDGGNPLGNGSLWLGVMSGYNFDFGGWSLAALVANDVTHTYRIGGGSGGFININATNTLTQGALRDLNGNPHNVIIAEDVRLFDNNPFTGTLTVNSGALCSGYLPDATGNPFGTNTGPVLLNGASGFYVINSYVNTRSVSKGWLTFDGGVGPISIDGNNANPSWITTVSVASLNRTGRSTLSIDAVKKVLGDKERMTVTGGVPSNNGMVAPYLWNGVDGVFLNYGDGGFTNAPFTQLSLATSTATDIVSVAAAAVPAGGAAVYALKASGILSGGTLTNHGGGLILTGNDITHTAPLDFGTNEAVALVNTPAANYHSLNGALITSGGLTKSGAGILRLRANNTGLLTGGIYVNQGTLDFAGWTNLGSVANTITMNGGTLYGGVASNDIVLGNLGGYLQGGTYAGNISGSGGLSVGAWNTSPILKGTNNTYSGGTWVAQFATVDAASSFGASGTVTLASYGHNSGNERGVLTLNGAGNLTTAHRLILNSFNSTVLFQSTAPVVGSIEGNGTISFGAVTHSTLRVGGNNRSTDYFGVLVESWAFSSTPRTGIYFGTLVKEGAGTLTLWGESWYRGGTIISNGTLCVNNWMNPVGTVVVKPGATLDGIGNVGIVSNLGGTVKGSLYMRRLAMNSASALNVTIGGTNVVSQYGQLHVSEGINLNSDLGAGSTLNLTLNFAPSPGQEFKILSNTSGASVTGTFSTGQRVSASFGGKTYWFTVDYNGGTSGKDIVLRAIPTGTVFTIR